MENGELEAPEGEKGTDGSAGGGQGGLAEVLRAEIAAGRVFTSATHFLGQVEHSLLEGIPKEQVWSSGVPLG